MQIEEMKAELIVLTGNPEKGILVLSAITEFDYKSCFSSPRDMFYFAKEHLMYGTKYEVLINLIKHKMFVPPYVVNCLCKD